MADTNFEGMSHQFKKNIYDKPKGWLREEVLWRDMTEHLPLNQGSPLTLLDCGAGEGQIALRCAQLGHDIHLNDLSDEMLDLARVRFTSHARKEPHCHEGLFQDLLPDMQSTYDLVICHAVLEWLEKPLQAISLLKKLIKPGGWLSLMFYNQHALVMHKVVKTHYFQVYNPKPMKRQSRFTPPNPLAPKDVFQAMEHMDMAPRSMAGIRVFFDYLEHGDQIKHITPDILDLELHYKNLFPYYYLGRYVHVTAQKR